MEDLFHFFVAAWETATDVLPPVAENDRTRRRRWNGAPRVELWIGTEQRRSESGSQLLLRDVVDLTAFGPSDRRDQLTEMMIAIPAVPGLDPDARQRLARQATIDMAHRFGFMSVTENSF